MKKMVLFVVFVLCLFQAQAYAESFRETISSPIGPVIKGLSLGMTVEDATKVLNANFPKKKPWKAFLESEPSYRYRDSEGFESQPSPAPIVGLNSKNRVLRIILDGGCFGNVANISADQFAKELFEAYKILEFESVQSSQGLVWKHTSNEGWEISVSNKRVVLILTEPQSTRKFD
jgi:hypothetical protein